MWIVTDYKGNQLVKCSDCGEIRPASEYGCPECGSTFINIIIRNEEDERSESYLSVL